MKLYSDEEAADKFIPIEPSDLPGGTGRPYPTLPFIPEDPLNEDKPPVEHDSIICDTSVTAGDNTVTVCKPPYDFPPVLKCPLHRPLLPMQLRNPGNWEYPALERVEPTVLKGAVENETNVSKIDYRKLIFKGCCTCILLVCIIMIPLIVKNRV